MPDACRNMSSGIPASVPSYHTFGCLSSWNNSRLQIDFSAKLRHLAGFCCKRLQNRKRSLKGCRRAPNRHYNFITNAGKNLQADRKSSIIIVSYCSVYGKDVGIMKKILLLTIQTVLVWMITAFFLYFWNRSHLSGLPALPELSQRVWSNLTHHTAWFRA